MIHVLFVCLGNICRSPMAEAIFGHLVTQAGLEQQITWDSAGTSNYHPGKLPDIRTRQVLEAHGIRTQHLARQVRNPDFEKYDYVLAMDQHNLRDLTRVFQSHPPARSKLELMGAYCEDGLCADVPDPYYGDLSDFEDVYQMLAPACQRLLTTICTEHRL